MSASFSFPLISNRPFIGLLHEEGQLGLAEMNTALSTVIGEALFLGVNVILHELDNASGGRSSRNYLIFERPHKDLGSTGILITSLDIVRNSGLPQNLGSALASAGARIGERVARLTTTVPPCLPFAPMDPIKEFILGVCGTTMSASLRVGI
jgi:hypothetical protein